MKLTVSCICGRDMAPLRTQGDAVFRCGCRARVSISGLPRHDPTDCPVPYPDGRKCGEKKSEIMHACDMHMEEIALHALAREDIRSRVVSEVVAAQIRSELKEPLRQALEVEAAKAAARQGRIDSLYFDVVYYVEVRPGIVKIGTTGRLGDRMRNLRVFDKSALLAVEPGAQKLEKMRHEQFAGQRIWERREDFRADETLRLHLDHLTEKYGDPWSFYEKSLTRQREDLARTAAQRYVPASSTFVPRGTPPLPRPRFSTRMPEVL